MGRRMRIRQLVAGFIVATMMVVAGSANAQNYPVKPITLIVPWPAGGPTDIVMRAIAEAASKHLGQPIIVDNKAGGGGTVGPATMAATAKPDGYTIAQMPITVYRLPLMQKVTYNPDTDFTFIAHLTGYVFAAFANTDTPFKTWADVVEYARKNPGKVTYASPGAGTSLHVAMEQIADKEGIKLTHVPFKGAAEVNTAVAGGHTMLGASGLSVKPLVDAGKVRFLNVWTAQRVKSLPDIPTLKELGYPWVFDSPFGIAGPKNMDPKIVAVLHDAFKKALDDPTVTKALDQFEMVVNYKNTEDYKTSVKEVTAMEKSLMERPRASEEGQGLNAAQEPVSPTTTRGTQQGRGSMSNRRFFAAAVATAMMAAAGLAKAQDYPVKPSHADCPFPAGGPTDVVMRAFADSVSKQLGQPVIVDNKSGGAGTVGPAAMAATAKPDGYTIAQMPITVYRLPLMQKAAYKADTDFTYIINLSGYAFAAFAERRHAVQDVGRDGRLRPQESGKVTYATPGAGSSLHIGMEQMADREGIKFTHVPFKGATEVNAAVAGGHTMLGASGLSVKPLVDAGRSASSTSGRRSA